MTVNGGIVNSQGTIAINATFGDGSTFQIGPDDDIHSAESEKIWTFDAGSIFEVNIKAGAADTLTINDSLTMNADSILKVNIIAGVVSIEPLDEFQFTLGGEFEAFNGTVIDNDQDLEFGIEIRDGNAFIVALSNGIVAPAGPLTPNQEAVKSLITDPDPNNACLLNVATALIGDGSLDQFATNLDRLTPYIYSLNNFFQIQNALWGAQSILRQSPLTRSQGCDNSDKLPTVLPIFLYGHANSSPHQPGGDSYSEGLQATFPFNDLTSWGQGENILSADMAMTFLYEKGFYYPVSGSSNQNTLLTTGALNLTNSSIGGELSLVSEYGLTGNTIHDTSQYLNGTKTTARSYYLSQTFLIGLNAMLAPNRLYAPPYMKKREAIRYTRKQRTAAPPLQILPSVGLNTAWQWNGSWEEQGAACFDRAGQKQREVWMMPNAMIHFLMDFQTMKGRYCILPSLSTGWEGVYPLEKNQQRFGLKKDLTSFATVTTNPGTRRNINQFRINANLTITNSRYFSAALNAEVKLFSGITQGNFSASLSNLF